MKTSWSQRVLMGFVLLYLAASINLLDFKLCIGPVGSCVIS